MTEKEFDILDQLYFVASFEDLLSDTGDNEEELKQTLKAMISKGWVTCYRQEQNVKAEGTEIIDREYKQLTYVATKAGLLEHNKS